MNVWAGLIPFVSLLYPLICISSTVFVKISTVSNSPGLCPSGVSYIINDVMSNKPWFGTIVALGDVELPDTL